MKIRVGAVHWDYGRGAVTTLRGERWDQLANRLHGENLPNRAVNIKEKCS